MGDTYSDIASICNDFSAYFQSNYTSPKGYPVQTINSETPLSIGFLNISANEVENALRSSSCDKNAGPDEIPPVI